MQIKLWDVRVTKPVQEYKGHYNEHAYLPIHVCEPEGLLLAGRRGQNMPNPTLETTEKQLHLNIFTVKMA